MGHPVLRKAAEAVPVSQITSPEIQALMEDMADTMFEYDGRGLAAPQIHESLQIVCMVWDFDKDKDSYVTFLVNPRLKALTEAASSYWEGCLSVPGLRGLVPRPNRISVECFNQRGEAKAFIAEGFAATVIQHECDHLLGKLYTDRMDDMTKLVFNHEYQKFHADAASDDEESGNE